MQKYAENEDKEYLCLNDFGSFKGNRPSAPQTIADFSTISQNESQTK